MITITDDFYSVIFGQFQNKSKLTSVFGEAWVGFHLDLDPDAENGKCFEMFEQVNNL